MKICKYNFLAKARKIFETSAELSNTSQTLDSLPNKQFSCRPTIQIKHSTTDQVVRVANTSQLASASKRSVQPFSDVLKVLTLSGIRGLFISFFKSGMSCPLVRIFKSCFVRPGNTLSTESRENTRQGPYLKQEAAS